MVYSAPFEDMRHANKHRGYGGGHNSSEKTSATWTESARGGRITVRIEKTDDAYKRKLKQYEDDQRELKNLGLLLQGLSGADGPAAKRVKTEEGL